MRQLVLFLFLISSLSNLAQDSLSVSKYGAKLNTSFNGELFALLVIPSISFTQQKNQLELGLILSDYKGAYQASYGGQINYKYYPNGYGNKFNLYFVGSFNYINTIKRAFYPINYNYLMLFGGYGYQQTFSKKWSLSTDFRFGGLTFSRKQESNLPSVFQKTKMFNELKLAYELQVNLGYRF